MSWTAILSRSKRILAIALLAAGAGLACDDLSGPGSVPSGGYAYTGLDSDGRLVVTGWLTLDVSNTNEVTGAWHLQAVGNSQDLGPQTGDGRLVGRMTGADVSVNLNPNVADNNVFLFGRLDGRTFRGDWTYSGFAGTLNRGSFEAFQR